MEPADGPNRAPELWEIEHSKVVFRHSLIAATIPLALLCMHLYFLVSVSEATIPRSDSLVQSLPGFNTGIAFLLAAAFTLYGRRAIVAWQHMRQLLGKAS